MQVAGKQVDENEKLENEKLFYLKLFIVESKLVFANKSIHEKLVGQEITFTRYFGTRWVTILRMVGDHS